MDVVTYALLSGKVSSVESMVTSLAEGFAYKGSKSSVSALPDDADAGDLYTVDGKKYVWDGTAWVELKDSVELDATLSTQGKAADAKAVGDALVTDTTLAVSGKAADAKVTGDEITGLKTAITQLESNWEYVDIPYNTLKTANYYVRTNNGTSISFQSQNGYSYFKIPVKKGDKFKSTFFCATNQYVCSYVLTKTDDTIVQITHDSTAYFHENIYTVSEDGYLYISVQDAAYYPFSIKKLSAPLSAYPFVSCVGDSLTQGNQDNSGITYPSVLNTLLGNSYYVANHGCGGDDSTEIAATCNSYNMYVEPFTIPGSTTQTAINLDIPAHGSAVDNPANQNINQLSGSTIANIPIRMYYSSGTYKVSRQDNSNEAVVIDRPEVMITPRIYEKIYTHVFWMGTNDVGLSANNISGLIDSIDSIIATLKHNNYIVLSLTSKSSFDDIDEINILLAKHYGNHFLNIRDYLLTYGLSDAEITPTAQDTTDIANGEIPTSLRVDSLHLNRYGYTIVANQVFKHGKLLGYWN